MDALLRTQHGDRVSQVHRLTVPAEQDNTRLDVYLASTGLISRRRARDLLAAGAVYLNRHRVKVASRIVRVGNQVEVHLLAEIPAPSTLELRLLYRDADLVVVDKPAGIPVQPTRDTDRGTVLEVLKRQLGPGAPEPKVVHRLDREASGAVVFALSARAAASLSAQLAEHAAQRIYLAAAVGESLEAETLRHFLSGLRAPAPGEPPGPARVHARPALGQPHRDERLAVAHARRLAHAGGRCLLQVRLETGRTHQIRAQLAAAGLPLVGDTRYGAPPLPSDGPLQRIALHAAALSVTHPATGRPLTVYAPIPEDLHRWLEAHRLWLPWLDSSDALNNLILQEASHGDHQAQPQP
jgi:23S rRNA pseudouridine1911/1915/1917 synthase